MYKTTLQIFYSSEQVEMRFIYEKTNYPHWGKTKYGLFQEYVVETVKFCLEHKYGLLLFLFFLFLSSKSGPALK